MLFEVIQYSMAGLLCERPIQLFSDISALEQEVPMKRSMATVIANHFVEPSIDFDGLDGDQFHQVVSRERGLQDDSVSGCEFPDFLLPFLLPLKRKHLKLHIICP